MENIQAVESEFIKEDEREYREYAKFNRGYEVIKRVFDFISSFMVSLILIIPCLLIALLIFIVDPGNPFFIQERVGKDNKPLKIVKFRSMKKNADDLKHMLTPEEYERYLKEFKLDNDPRLLPHNIGKYIRKLSVDEIPQIIFNICLKGDMSVVGPRPILRKEMELNYTPEQQEALTGVKPGLTGYWQAYGRNNVGYSDGERQRMELYYVQNRSIGLDIKIIFRTVKAVLSQDGVK